MKLEEIFIMGGEKGYRHQKFEATFIPVWKQTLVSLPSGFSADKDYLRCYLNCAAV